jgi:hypothetical protein
MNSKKKGQILLLSVLVMYATGFYIDIDESK